LQHSSPGKEALMLVFTRKVGERIVISGDVVITVTKIKGQRICVAIEAPRSVPIRRGELAALRPPRQPADVPSLA